MSGNVIKTVGRTFRDKFQFAHKDVMHYFPGHMAKGLKQMQNKLRSIDCVVEVHDARIPLSGRNTVFKTTVISVKPHILLLNKVDLADIRHKTVLNDIYKQEGVSQVLYTNCKENIDYVIKKQLLPTILEVIQGSPRFNREHAEDYNLLIIGVPNVGKSSLINALRRTQLKKGKANPVGAKAGVTRSLMTRVKVSESPPIFLFDTPGVLFPDITDVEVAMKLALCANLQDHLVGEEHIVDYMLYWLNKHKKFKYMTVYGLEEPLDDVYQLLFHVAKANKLITHQRSVQNPGLMDIRPNFNAAARLILEDFRMGKLGKVNLDLDYFENQKETTRLSSLPITSAS